MTHSLRPLLRLLPLLAVAFVAFAAALSLQLQLSPLRLDFRAWRLTFAAVVLAKGAAFFVYRLHRFSWRQATLFDAARILAASVAASLAAFVALVFLAGRLHGPAAPPSVFIVDAAFTALILAALVLGVRLCHETFLKHSFGSAPPKPVLIYGAGCAGLVLAREIHMNPRLGKKVAGFLDDDSRKKGTILFGAPVLGSGHDAANLVARFERRNRAIAEIIIAMPSASGRQMRAAVANCRAAGVPVKTVPGVAELLERKGLNQQVRNVSVNDLLGREPVRTDERGIALVLAGKSVLVTGGCGSIGSELCRQVLRFGPRRLIVFDKDESPMFMLALELRERYPSADIVTEIGDIRRGGRVEAVVAAHGVQVVFHAAAYKHVPLMEEHPLEAIENNVLGTFNVAQVAHRHGVERFVMISTDKAVNPVSIMGATKRAAELIVSAMPLDGSPSSTRFVSVRFGNVLASAGSVVPIFQKQIAAGGPVTITHPAMQRYFMSIQEAVQLVLQASALGVGSEVFVLDMGTPVSIVSLAENMIRLAGLVPGEDIEIRYTGLRPGERLYEELSFGDEAGSPTVHEKIRVFRSDSPRPASLARWLDNVRVLLRDRRAAQVSRHLAALIPEFRPSRAGAVPAAAAPKAVVKAS